MKVSVQYKINNGIYEMHQEHIHGIHFLHRRRADRNKELSGKMRTILIFADAFVRFYEDDYCLCR